MNGILVNAQDPLRVSAAAVVPRSGRNWLSQPAWFGLGNRLTSAARNDTVSIDYAADVYIAWYEIQDPRASVAAKAAFAKLKFNYDIFCNDHAFDL